MFLEIILTHYENKQKRDHTKVQIFYEINQRIPCCLTLL